MRSLIFGTVVAALILGPFAVSQASAVEAKCEPAALGKKYPSLVGKTVRDVGPPDRRRTDCAAGHW
jgi:hypothetical protein